MKLESTNRLVIDREKSRFENNHPPPDPNRKIIERKMVFLFNGSSRLTFAPTGATDRDKPQGGIEESAPAGIGWQVLAPIELSFRGLNPQDKKLAVGAMNPIFGFVVLEGERCQAFDVAPSAFKDRGNRIIDQLDVHYRQDQLCGLVPDSWTLTTTTVTGSKLITTSVAVLEMRLNEPQAPEVFDIKFPAGTIVSRSTHGNSTRNKIYEVLKDGTMREITQTGHDSWHQQVIWSTIICLLMIAATLLFRRRSQERQQRQTN
jgi:hypothetical protein